jgi:hypothetical protein
MVGVGVELLVRSVVGWNEVVGADEGDGVGSTVGNSEIVSDKVG